MQSTKFIYSRSIPRSSYTQKLGVLLLALLLAITVNTTDVNKAESRILSGALIGGGIGAVFGGSRGAVAGAITGGVLGALSKRKKRKKRRW